MSLYSAGISKGPNRGQWRPGNALLMFVRRLAIVAIEVFEERLNRQ
jgi:hypothetical protein